MTHIIAIANQKGGVGKTTTSINLAASLQAIKQRVLLIDMDPQGNATVGSGIDLTPEHQTVAELLVNEEVKASAVRLPTAFGFDVLPANRRLTSAEVHMMQLVAREYQMKQKLDELHGDYDFILIDCPPSLNILTINALVCANAVLIPMQCEYYALEGLAALLNTIKRLRQTANPGLQIEGVLRTMYDGRNRLTQEVSSELHQHFGEKVYQVVIPRNVRLAEAPSHGKPALHYDKQAQGAAAYLALAVEMVRKHEAVKTKEEQEIA